MNKYILLLLFNAFLTALSQILLKKASLNKYESFFSQYINPYVIIGYGIFFIVMMLNIYALKYVSMITMNAFNNSVPYMIVLLSSTIIFKEKWTLKKIFAIICILTGIYLVIL